MNKLSFYEQCKCAFLQKFDWNEKKALAKGKFSGSIAVT
jgi:hypothetical protein